MAAVVRGKCGWMVLGLVVYTSMMTVFVALLRAVNVGGTGKLLMSELTRMCEVAGFTAVRTYIASGNVVFASDGTEAQVKATLENSLSVYARKPVGVLVRTFCRNCRRSGVQPFSRDASHRRHLSRSAAPRRRLASARRPDG
jgi:uncharacterized protein (DUF1697 family)